MMAKVIAFINYKGGVAKTTTTYHVGCSLAQHFGKRVLFVDIDPQTNLTFLCASIMEWQRFKTEDRHHRYDLSTISTEEIAGCQAVHLASTRRLSTQETN